VCDKYVEELVAAVPELKVINELGDIVGARGTDTSKILMSAVLWMRMVSSGSGHWPDRSEDDDSNC